MSVDPTCVLDFPMFPGVNTAGVIRNQSGYGNHAQPVNFAGDDSEFVHGKLGQAVDLDGVSKYLNCGHDDSLDIIHQITIEIVFYLDTAVGNRQLITKYNPPPGGGNDSFFLRSNAGTLEFYLRNAADTLWNNAAGPVAISARNWHIVHAVYDMHNMLAYLDGTPGAAVAKTDNILSSPTTDVIIGSITGSGDWVDGKINRARMWKRAIGAAEAQRRFKYPWRDA